MNESLEDSYRVVFGWGCRLLTLFALLLIVGGCSTAAHQQAVSSYNMAYQSQVDAVRQMVNAQQASPNLVEIELHPDGSIKRLAVGREIKMPNLPKYSPPQDKTAEVWGKLGVTALRTAGTLVGVGLVSSAIVDLAETAGTSNTYNGDITGSYNTAGGDYNGMSAGRDIGTGTITDTDYTDSFNDNRAYNDSVENIDNDNSDNTDNSTVAPEEGVEE